VALLSLPAFLTASYKNQIGAQKLYGISRYCEMSPRHTRYENRGSNRTDEKKPANESGFKSISCLKRHGGDRCNYTHLQVINPISIWNTGYSQWEYLENICCKIIEKPSLPAGSLSGIRHRAGVCRPAFATPIPAARLGRKRSGCRLAHSRPTRDRVRMRYRN
jgi:hypothetical protein